MNQAVGLKEFVPFVSFVGTSDFAFPSETRTIGIVRSFRPPSSALSSIREIREIRG
jgi:hypothetical protein